MPARRTLVHMEERCMSLGITRRWAMDPITHPGAFTRIQLPRYLLK